nr:uncharacterized protein LOC129440979 isoform X2 [Misgurnus anguillicaudatus]
MKLPAPVKGSSQWSDLSDTVDHNASFEESTPPSAKAAGTHQKNIKDTETKDLKVRAETLVFDLVRFSGWGYVSAEFRFKVGQSLVSFALTSEEACSLVRDTLDREMLRLRKEERWAQKLIELNRFIERFPMIFVDMKCQLPSWVLEDLEDSDLSSNEEDEPVETIPPPADPPTEGPLVPAPEPPPGLLFFPAPAPQPQAAVAPP